MHDSLADNYVLTIRQLELMAQNGWTVVIRDHGKPFYTIVLYDATPQLEPCVGKTLLVAIQVAWNACSEAERACM